MNCLMYNIENFTVISFETIWVFVLQENEVIFQY